MGILKVSQDGARAVSGEGLDPPNVDPGSAEELGAPSAEGVPAPSPSPGGLSLIHISEPTRLALI
eukprot:14709791-Alexandrium_andersonii.AAC.1